MAKATHKGTCQVCGCVQMLPNGVLSNHGYSVQYNFFSGICNGAKSLPFEQSTDLIDDAIKSAKELVAVMWKEINSLYKNPLAWRMVYHETLKESFWEIVELSNDGYQFYNTQRNCWEHNGYWGSLQDILLRMTSSRIRWLKRRIKEIISYIRWQENRIKGWEPKPLIER